MVSEYVYIVERGCHFCPFTTVGFFFGRGGGSIVGFPEKSMPHYRKENIIYSQQIYTKGTNHLTFIAVL
jgi:hypothetical protein